MNETNEKPRPPVTATARSAPTPQQPAAPPPSHPHQPKGCRLRAAQQPRRPAARRYP